MSWTINLLYAILFTTITGSIFTVVWWLIGRFLEKMGFLNISYSLLKLVMVFWIIPVSYGTIQLWDLIGKRWGGNLFLETPTTYRIAAIFFVVWIVGMALSFARYIIEWICLLHIRRTTIPCEEYIQKCFGRLLMEMGYDKNSVMVRQSYHVGVPQLTGCIRPMVLLPVKEYTEKELQIVFAHELTHHKHHDIFVKNCAVMVRTVHFMNPISWWFCDMLDRWSEFACDYEVCRKVGSLKQYYTIITDMVQEMALQEVMVSRLVENKQKLIERMEHVKMSYYKQARSRKIAALLLTGILVLSGTSVYAASVESANTVHQVNEATNEMVEVIMDETPEMDLIEYEELVSDSDVIEIEGETELLAANKTAASFNWTIGSKLFTKTSTFWVKSGKHISVTVSNPSGTSIRVGIIKPGGLKVYVSGTGYASHSFSADTTGSYRVFVQNMGSSSISVTGTYLVY